MAGPTRRKSSAAASGSAVRPCRSARLSSQDFSSISDSGGNAKINPLFRNALTIFFRSSGFTPARRNTSTVDSRGLSAYFNSLSGRISPAALPVPNTAASRTRTTLRAVKKGGVSASSRISSRGVSAVSKRMTAISRFSASTAD